MFLSKNIIPVNTSYPCVGWWRSTACPLPSQTCPPKERYGEMVQDQRKPWPLFVAWWQFWAGIGPIPKTTRSLSPYFIWVKLIWWIDRFILIEYVVPQIVEIYQSMGNCSPRWQRHCYTSLSHIIVIISIKGTVEKVIENYWIDCLVHLPDQMQTTWAVFKTVSAIWVG